jgi:PAS domain S-box-containing protein
MCIILITLCILLPAGVALWTATFSNSALQPVLIILLSNALALGLAFFGLQRWLRNSERRQKSLTISEKRHRITAEMTSDYSFYHKVHADGSVERVWVSGAFEQVTGYPASEMIADSTRRLYHEDDALRAAADRQRVIAGEPVDAEYRILRSDQTLRWLRVVRVPDWDADHQRVIGYYGVAHDITARKAEEEERLQLALRQQQFAIVSEFVRAISHDFRNRLSTIESNRHIITRIVDPNTKEKINPRLDNIRASMQGIMQQLDNLAVIAGLGTISIELVDLNHMLRQLENRYLARAFEKRVQLHFQCNDALSLHMDESQIEHVFHHLIENALAHTPAGGEISIRASRSVDGVVIEVSDTGAGIAEDQLSRVFEPFYRGDDARTINEAGVGVGLTIARLIVEAHQGTIELSSTVGQGTTFRISLPMAKSMVA